MDEKQSETMLLLNSTMIVQHRSTALTGHLLVVKVTRKKIICTAIRMKQISNRKKLTLIKYS